MVGKVGMIFALNLGHGAEVDFGKQVPYERRIQVPNTIAEHLINFDWLLL
jgi:hypothetical protein